MIAKSFCDITSHDQQLTHLTEFNKHDVITKRLHLYCNKIDGNAKKETTVDENIAVLMALGYEKLYLESIPNTSPSHENDAKSPLIPPVNGVTGHVFPNIQ
eukprot:972866_1